MVDITRLERRKIKKNDKETQGKVSVQKDHRDEFIEFLGIWTKEEEEEFNKATEDLDKIDPLL